MTIHISITRPAPKRRKASLWRRWWLRAAHKRQMRQLDTALLDPHLARDIGMQPRVREPRSTTLW